jgi:3D (Asp-Asp-Asp) domain-containing protein
VWRLARFAPPLLLVTIGCAICGAVGAASGAGAEKTDGRSVAALRRAGDTLTQRIRTATLDLYSLDAHLERAHSQLAALRAQRERIARERSSLRLRLDVTRHNARVANRRLAVLVRNLYEQQTSDPLAIVLGAQSLEDAITSLDDLSRSAQTHRQIAQTSRHAKRWLVALRRKLERQDAHVRANEEAAARSAAALVQARNARGKLISELSARRGLAERQIARIEALASASAAATAAAPAPAAAVPAGARTLTVTATAYATAGTTATGLPTGWGTVAVDPSMIPLGTRLTIPGYGDGVAADTGSAVAGSTIDLWFPTEEQALAWGRRAVVVTLH